MSNALSTQIDGTHYKNQKMQPIELAYLVGGTPCFTKLAKYLTRDKGDKIINLNKAIHCIQIEQEISSKASYHILESYPSLQSYAKSDLAGMVIDVFSEDEQIREALKSMYNQRYEDAISAVTILKSMLGVGEIIGDN